MCKIKLNTQLSSPRVHVKLFYRIVSYPIFTFDIITKLYRYNLRTRPHSQQLPQWTGHLTDSITFFTKRHLLTFCHINFLRFLFWPGYYEIAFCRFSVKRILDLFELKQLLSLTHTHSLSPSGCGSFGPGVSHTGSFSSFISIIPLRLTTSNLRYCRHDLSRLCQSSRSELL